MSGRGGKRSTSFKPGRSGNPGGRPKLLQSVTDLARAETEQNIQTLVAVRDDNDAPHGARIAASNALLDRGWGKPAQTMNANVNEKRSATDWTRAELVAFLDNCKRERSKT